LPNFKEKGIFQIKRVGPLSLRKCFAIKKEELKTNGFLYKRFRGSEPKVEALLEKNEQDYYNFSQTNNSHSQVHLCKKNRVIAFLRLPPFSIGN